MDESGGSGVSLGLVDSRLESGSCPKLEEKYETIQDPVFAVITLNLTSVEIGLW